MVKKYVGYLDRKVTWVSETKLSDAANVIEIDTALDDQTIIQEYEVKDNQLIHCFEKRDPKNLKIAMITSYGINCGLATYAKYLGDALRPLVKELKFFAELDPNLQDQPDVVRCWDRKTGDYSGIFKAIQDYNPDIIYVQHEYGVFNHGANWNALISNLSAHYRTVVVLHSVYDHFDKLIYEAPCAEIIVHSKSSRELLKKRGINHANIHYIPHGCLEQIQVNTKFSSIHSDHVIFQFGFGFQYKGWDQVIEIVDKLKNIYPDILYVGVFNISQYSKEFHNYYYSNLIKIISDKGLQKHISLHKGFRSEEVLYSYMAQSKVNLFPYTNHFEWLVHGASGAVRLALASGTVCVLGDVPFFTEFKGTLPICSSVDEYVSVISKLFDDKNYAESIKQLQKQFIENRTWDKIAQWYLNIDPRKEFTAL